MCFPRWEPPSEEWGAWPVGDSDSIYQLCGCPPPEEADWVDCIRFPGSISSFLFLKTLNFQSDFSQTTSEKKIVQSAAGTNILRMPEQPEQLYLLPHMSTHDRGSGEQVPHCLSRQPETMQLPRPQWEARRSGFPDITVSPHRHGFHASQKGLCEH